MDTIWISHRDMSYDSPLHRKSMIYYLFQQNVDLKSSK
jgi:hypothetical protein